MKKLGTTETAIDVRHVSKTFKDSFGAQSFKQSFVNIGHKLVGHKELRIEKSDYTALEEVNFAVRKGDFFGIVGRNGSGKSTLLKIIAGVYTPSSGEVIVDGRLTPFIELGVGFNPELSGHDNVYLNGALLGFNRRQMDLLYDDIVEFAELKDFMSMKLKNYSSGMQVRLAFSVAIRVKGDILVVDEVLAVGDAAFQRKCFDYFMDLKKNKQTVVLVTHDMGAIRQYCDRAVLIDDGKVKTIGSAEKVAQEYQKMFSQEDESRKIKSAGGKSTRWGTGKMIARRPVISVTNESVTILTEYDAQEDLDTAVVGFSIYGPDGHNILENNTINLKHKIRALKKGEHLSFEWRVPNVFSTGQYEVSVACCNKSATEFYDWVNRAGVFRIQKDYLTSGLVNPAVQLKQIK